MDMYSRMYSSVEQTVELSKKIDKPLILCEYIHAMGNGPGNIKDYVESFFAYPNVQGGFVWEWANHGLVTKDRDTGEEFYGYGGDFGETLHDGNFCMDGILFSDHTPTPGLPEYKKALEPIKVVSLSHDPSWSAKIVNRYDYLTLDHLECRFVILQEGQTVDSGTIDIEEGVEPGHLVQLDLSSLRMDQTLGESILRLSLHTRSPSASLPVGFEVAFDERLLEGEDSFPLFQSAVSDDKVGSRLEVRQRDNLLSIHVPTVTWTFSPHDGHICDFIKNGASFLASGPHSTFYRALTDNDGPIDGAEWLRFRLHEATLTTRHCNWTFEDEHCTSFVVEVEQRFAPPALNWSIDLHTRYTFDLSGSVSIRVRGEPRGTPLPQTLPRIGLTMELPGEWSGLVTWYGRGPGESYNDKKLSQRVAVHNVSSVDALWTDYEYPQEGGNRTDTRWARFTYGPSGETVTGQFVKIGSSTGKSRSRELFDFQASHYHCRDVDEAKHPHELRKKKTGNLVLRLDSRHHGLGSGACGPKTDDAYALRLAPFDFEVVLA